MASNPSSISGCTFWIDPSDQNNYTIAQYGAGPFSVYTELMNKMSTPTGVPFATGSALPNSTIDAVGPLYYPGETPSTVSVFPNGSPLLSNSSELVVDYNFNHNSNFTIITAINKVIHIPLNPMYFFIAPSSLAIGYFNSSIMTVTGNGSSWNSPGEVSDFPTSNALAKFLIVTATYSNNTLDTYINNTLYTTRTGPVAAFSNFYLGGKDGSYSAFNAMADFIIYNSSLNADQRVSVNRYLTEKYSILTAPPNIEVSIRPKVKENSVEYWWNPPHPSTISTFGVPITNYRLNYRYYVDDSTSNDSSIKIQADSRRFLLQFSNSIPGFLFSTSILCEHSTNTLNAGATTSYYRNVSTCTKPGLPTSPSFSNIAGNQYTISWTNPGNMGSGVQLGTVLTAYPLDVGNNLISSPNLLIKSSAPLDSTSANISLISGSNYKVLIQAVNDAGYSPKTLFTSTITVA